MLEAVEITHHKPAARGVSQLMYVGDTEPPTGPTIPTAVKMAIALALGWLLLRSK